MRKQNPQGPSEEVEVVLHRVLTKEIGANMRVYDLLGRLKVYADDKWGVYL